MKIGNKEFDLENNTYVMGILNLTPDSFSDGGSYNNMEKVINRVHEMIKEGADIIDIGGESTRPGYTVISEEEEIERIVPYLREIKKRFDIPVSIDTYKAKVALETIKEGADMINDIWGLKRDKGMAEVIANFDIPCCLMHNRNISINPYKDFVNDVIEDLSESIAIAIKAGISRDKIITDPGVGFAKSLENNLTIINKLDILKKLECPYLLGTSRKSVIGLTLEEDIHNRMEGTLATTVVGVMKGASIVRVHDIKENKRAIRMTKAIIETT